MNSIRCPINRMALSRQANRAALICGTRTLAYRCLESAIATYEDVLKSNGVRRGNKVALWADTSAEFIVAYFALLRRGCCSYLINTKLPMQRTLKDLAGRDWPYVIVPANLQPISPSLHIIHPPKISFLSKGTAERRCQFYKLEASANIMFTSGSSGQPKAVVHSIGNHYYSASGSNRHIPVTRQDAWLLSLPVYHVAGLSIIWRCILAGASIIIPRKKDNIEACLRLNSPTHMSCVAVQVDTFLQRAVMRNRLKVLKAVLLGGSALPSKLIQDCIAQRIPIYTSYGLTEMSSQVATTGRIRKPADAQHAKILPYRQLKIGAANQILVRGKTLCKGFWVKGRIKPAAKGTGWYPTGDRGQRRRDGSVEIWGRMDNMFISGGENIYPEEIERSLTQISEIRQAIVVPRPCAKYGQRPVAFVRMLPQRKISVSRIRAHLATCMEKFKQPDDFYCWPKNLRASDFKVKRQQLSAMLLRPCRKLQC